jgi:hypothetical protein
MIQEVKQSDQFWEQLLALSKYLKPFQVATDIVQSDNATLVQVYTQFHMLLTHVSHPDPSIYPAPYSSILSKEAANIINVNWRKHVNIPATIAAASLSFSPTDIFPQSDIQTATDFIPQFGAQYLFQYKKAPGSIDFLQANILSQYSDFVGRANGFTSCVDTVKLLKSAGYN